MKRWQCSGRGVAGVLLAAGLVLLLAGCASGSGPKPETVKGQIVVLPGLNPNFDDRPSPVTVQVYQLRDRDAFVAATLQDLAMRDTETLGGALLSRDSFELCPVEMGVGDPLGGGLPCQGEELAVQLAIYPEVRFIAVVAGFFDVQSPSAQWRTVTALPKEGFWDFIGSNSFTITLDRSRVTVQFD